MFTDNYNLINILTEKKYKLLIIFVCLIKYYLQTQKFKTKI